MSDVDTGKVPEIETETETEKEMLFEVPAYERHVSCRSPELTQTHSLPAQFPEILYCILTPNF
jgi:hypothetical protein